MDQNRNLFCQFCSKQIPASNHNLHEIYCARQKRVCQICHQFIDQNIILQHRLTHKENVCPKCKQNFSGNQQHHNLTCKMKLQFCVFCDQDIPHFNFKVHRETCSRRNKVCDWCKNNIKIIEYSYHITYCKYKNDISKFSKNNSQTTIKNSISQRVLNRKFANQKIKKSQQIIRQESTSLQKKCKNKNSIQFQAHLNKRNFRTSKNQIQKRISSLLKINSGLLHGQQSQQKIIDNNLIPNLQDQYDYSNPIPITIKQFKDHSLNFFENYQQLLTQSIHK